MGKNDMETTPLNPENTLDGVTEEELKGQYYHPSNGDKGTGRDDNFF